MNMETKVVSLSLPGALIEKIDRRRGLVSRSRFVARLLLKSAELADAEGEQYSEVNFAEEVKKMCAGA